MWQQAHHSLWIMWQKAHHSLWIIGCDVSKHSRCVWASLANYSLCLASDSCVLQTGILSRRAVITTPGTESHHGVSDTLCVKQLLCLKVVRRFHKRWRLFINSAAKVRFRSAPETSRVTGAEMNFACIPVAIHQRPLPIIPCLKEGEIYQRGSTQSSPWVRSFSRRRSADRQRKGAPVPSSYRQDKREQTGSVFLLHNHYGLGWSPSLRMSLFIEGDSCGSLLSLDRHYIRAVFFSTLGQDSRVYCGGYCRSIFPLDPRYFDFVFSVDIWDLLRFSFDFFLFSFSSWLYHNYRPCVITLFLIRIF